MAILLRMVKVIRLSTLSSHVILSGIYNNRILRYWRETNAIMSRQALSDELRKGRLTVRLAHAKSGRATQLSETHHRAFYGGNNSVNYTRFSTALRDETGRGIRRVYT